MFRGFLVVCFLLFFPHLAAAEMNSTLTLVYKDAGTSSYMGVAPDSSGLYKDLMTRAAEKIGFKLKIVRGPKKRLYKMLEEGEADLYASAAFRVSRSKFLFYMLNGLYRHKQYYGLTSLNIPMLSNIKDISKYDLSWVVEMGSSSPERAKVYGLKHLEIEDVTVERAVQMLTRDRPFFFLINKIDVHKYMKEHHLASMCEVGVRLHCCYLDVAAPLYSNFSRNSPYYHEEPNLRYDAKKPLSPENFPFQLVAGSVSYKFQKALREMIDSGEVEALARKYFGTKWRCVINKDEKAASAGK